MSFADFKCNTENVFQRILVVTQNVNRISTSCEKNSILKERSKDNLIAKIVAIEKDLGSHLEKIRRRQMKCVFFGQTSNGKSAMINAILGRVVLPSSDGRTTSCFITIDSCEEDPYFKINGVRENDINKLISAANEICDNHLTIESHIQLFWPSYECNLLNENVQLLDSPGVDYSTNNDSWIDKYCRDSDIFVYVVNSQATINESERVFFRKVTSFIKNPNIFVVMNKWDLCDIPGNEKKIDKIKQQHLVTVKNFLCNDLNLRCDPMKKTFFLSAKEQLQNFGKESHSDLKVNKRMEEFKKFNETLCDEMTKNAIINKFRPHLDKGDEYLSDIEEVLKQFQSVTRCDAHRNNKQRDELINEINELITNIFNKIIEEGKVIIKSQCPKLSNALMTEVQHEQYILDYVRQEIISSLQETLIENIDQLKEKMKNLFVSCSEFQLSDKVLNSYIPYSFEEHSTKLGKALASNIKKGDSKAQDEYISKTNEMKNNWGPCILSNIGDAGNTMSIGFLLKYPPAGAILMAASKFLSKASVMLEDSNKREIKENMRAELENILVKYMNDSFKKCQDEIKDGVNRYVDTFCDDHEVARELLKEINNLRQRCQAISEDLQLERIKIMSIE